MNYDIFFSNLPIYNLKIATYIGAYNYQKPNLSLPNHKSKIKKLSLSVKDFNDGMVRHLGSMLIDINRRASLIRIENNKKKRLILLEIEPSILNVLKYKM